MLRETGVPEVRAALASAAAATADVGLVVSQALGAQQEPSLIIVDDVGTARSPNFQPLGALRVLLTTAFPRHAQGNIVRVEAPEPSNVHARVAQLENTPAYQLLVVLACFPEPAEAVPCAWVESEAGLAASDARNAWARLAELELAQVDEAQGLAQMHQIAAHEVRKRRDAAARLHHHDKHQRAAAVAYRLGEFHGGKGAWGSAYRLFCVGQEAARQSGDRRLVDEGERLLAQSALTGATFVNT
jgi:hypothetical protein